MLKLTLYLWLAYYASIPVMNKELLPGSEPLPAQEIEFEGGMIILNEETK